MGLKWPNPDNKGIKWTSHALNLAFFGSLAAGVVIAESQPGQHVRVGAFENEGGAVSHAETWNQLALGAKFGVHKVGEYYVVDSTARYEDPQEQCKAMLALVDRKNGHGPKHKQCDVVPR